MHKIIKKVNSLVIIFSSFLMAMTYAQASELPPYIAYYGGPISSKGNSHTYKTWGVTYVYRSASPLGWTLGYHNEGYFPGHYRDGLSLQLLAHTEPFNPNWSFAAAAGPYSYFDTAFSPGNNNYSNRHGLGMKLDLMTSYDYSPFVFLLGLDHVLTYHRFNTTALIFGLGLQLDPSSKPTEQLDGESTHNNEFTVFTGRELVNAGSGQVQRSLPMDLDYRHHFTHLDWTVSLLNEGKTTLTNREGFASEVWARKDFFSNRLSLGAGVGPYIAREKIPENKQRIVVNGLMSLTASYVLYKPWLVGRVTWHRVFTQYNRDSDVFLLGLGVNF